MREVLLFTGLLLLCGCQTDPHAARSSNQGPKREDVVGIYAPDTETWKDLLREGQYPKLETAILLATDGSFTLKDMPDCWNTADRKARGGFDSGRGAWKIVRHGGGWAVALYFRSTEGFSSRRSAESFETILLLKGKRAPYKLQLTRKNPVTERAMQFEKIQ